jgi:hypothetical protein
MKTILTLVTAISLSFLFSGTASAVYINGSGSAVIQDNNLKQAEDLARDNALKNALRSYFANPSNLNSAQMPEITKEFFKFITGYKILSRSVQDFTVTYNISADIDDIALSNINHYIREATNSVVFYIMGNAKGEQKSDLLDEASSILEKNRFTIKYNSDFLAEIPDRPSPSDLITAFAGSQAQYLLVFTINSQMEPQDDVIRCETELLTKPISRGEEFSTIKVVKKTVQETEDLCASESFKAAANTTVEYIRKNIIKLPQSEVVDTDYNIKAVNFGKFSRVKTFIDFLQRRDILTSYKIKTYSIEEVVIEAETSFDRDSLLRNINSLREKFNYEMSSEGNELMLDFSYTAE